MAPNITEITSTSQFDSIVRGLPPTQLLVIDFHAVWCGPCHAIAPVFEQLSNKFTHVKFVKIDVDKQAALAQRFGIRAMPTFKFLKGGREIDEIRGASPPQLTSLISRHAGPVPPPTAKASPDPGPAAKSKTSTTSATAVAPSDSSLLPLVVATGLACLNESKSHPLSSIVGPNAGPKGQSYLESDVDPELLISLHFRESVKIKSISIFSGVSPSQAPKTVQLFINQTSMDFNDAQSLTPAQELVLTPKDVKGERVDLRYVRFQNVRSLHILVKDNQEGEETTRIDSFDVFGIPADTMERGALPRGEDN